MKPVRNVETLFLESEKKTPTNFRRSWWARRAVQQGVHQIRQHIEKETEREYHQQQFSVKADREYNNIILLHSLFYMKYIDKPIRVILFVYYNVQEECEGQYVCS